MFPSECLYIIYWSSLIQSVYIFKDGEVLEKGSHDELMDRKGYYYTLVKIQELEERDKAAKVVR